MMNKLLQLRYWQTTGWMMMSGKALGIDGFGNGLECLEGRGRKHVEFYSNGAQISKINPITMTNLINSDCGSTHKENGRNSRPLPFTGCLAHAEVVYSSDGSKVLRIRGYLFHNDGCISARYANAPLAPLHPDVFKHCLQLLRTGSPLTEIKARNHAAVQAKSYPSMPKTFEGQVNMKYRWVLHDSDTRAMYRQFNREQGIDTRIAAHINVHQWLDKSSPKFNKTLADAVFHYSARASKNECFEICISTEEMKKAAWDYGHESQIILDGTFGICDRKLLLFIIMGIDDKNVGVPLAFLLFSAPSENQQTSSGYNSEILRKLLERWVHSLGTKGGVTFLPAVCITDTDHKERNALSLVLPYIVLLICRFHIRQSWRNSRTKRIRGDSALHRELLDGARHLEAALLLTESFSIAKQLVLSEKAKLQLLPMEHSSTVKQAEDHLDYLSSYWLASEALWESWSARGRILAAKRMNCPIENIVTTTNHLESFNNVLKGKHLQRWKHGGRRLRVDVLLRILVDKIVPGIFAQRRADEEELQVLEERWKRLPGGDEVIKKKRQQAQNHRARGRKWTGTAAASEPVVFYLAPDASRDSSAQDLLDHRQISTPIFNDGIFRFTCFSAQALEGEDQPTVYDIELRVEGTGACSCPDFQHRGGACKHLRAAVCHIRNLNEKFHLNVPEISIPTTKEDAIARTSHPDSLMDPIDRALQSTIDTFLQTDDPFLTTDGLDANDNLDITVESPITSQDSDHDEEVSDNESAFSEGQERSAKAGVDDQAIARALNELESIIPRLMDIRVLLESAHTGLQFEDRLSHIRSALEMVTAQIDRLTNRGDNIIDGIHFKPEPAQPQDQSIPTTHPSQKHPIDDLLPPSPEKTQKRKKSYSHH